MSLAIVSTAPGKRQGTGMHLFIPDNRIVADVVQSSVQFLLTGFDEDKFSNLEAPVKAMLGTVIEKRFLKAMSLPYRTGSNRGQWDQDTVIDGISVDIKCTVGKNWMIPPETVGHWCLLFQIDVNNGTFSLGKIRALEQHLTPGQNRDRKRSISKSGKAKIAWMISDMSFLS